MTNIVNLDGTAFDPRDALDEWTGIMGIPEAPMLELEHIEDLDLHTHQPDPRPSIAMDYLDQPYVPTTVVIQQKTPSVETGVLTALLIGVSSFLFVFALLG